MRSFILFATIIVWFPFAVASGGAGDALSKRGYDEIALCMTEYTRLAGEPIADAIDRVYVHVFNNLDGLLFTSGAVGTFGKRSPAYASYLGCDVQNGEVVSMSESFTRFLIDDVDDVISDAYEEYHEGTVIELLYLRVDGRFEFCCSQPFDADNIDKHNPDMKREVLEKLKKLTDK